jgi:hypothetical protein
MATFRPSLAPKASGLHPKEYSALQDVSKHRAVEESLLHRLQKLGHIEQKTGVWSTTQQGEILLMFRAAR